VSTILHELRFLGGIFWPVVAETVMEAPYWSGVTAEKSSAGHAAADAGSSQVTMQLLALWPNCYPTY
jgi:hypothetical protein